MISSLAALLAGAYMPRPVLEHRGGVLMAALTMTRYSTPASADRSRRAATKATKSAK